MSTVDHNLQTYAYVERGPMPRETPESFPGYEVLEELGRGGMGIVYRARQLSLNRIVAVKMLLGRSESTQIDRFRVEAEAIGQLQHANIIQIFEIGEVDGSPYYTLEFCPNGSLAHRLNGKAIDNREAAELIRDIAIAMESAHQAGIVHRDLKPANVLMAADGRPKVSDFGIAKTEGGDSHTQTGAIIGTPSYMAPEQAGGLAKSVGPTADVYALGAILYECLTGRAPFVGQNPLETIQQVIDQDPVPPTTINPLADSDLEKIVLKCLEKKPEARYATAQELAEDLQRYLDGEQVTARSVNLIERLQRELNRNSHDAKLRPWGAGIMWLGAIVFLSHLCTSILLSIAIRESVAFWIPRSIMLISIVLWVRQFNFANALLPTNPLERMLWATWLGYLFAFMAMFWVMDAMNMGHLEMYGPAMVISGMAWFTMGGCIWGGCYIIGIVFMLTAPLMTKLNDTPWGPLLFGTIWGVTLIMIGRRYMRAGERQLPTGGTNP